MAGGGDVASLDGTGSMAEAGPAAAVPEPSTFVLLGVAAVGLLAFAAAETDLVPRPKKSFPGRGARKPSLPAEAAHLRP